MPDVTTRDTSTSTSTATAETSAATTDASQDLLGNQGVIDIIKAENNHTGDRAADPGKTGIVHVGMNKYASAESAHLNRLNRDDGGAVGIRDQKDQDQLSWGGKKYDFTSLEDCAHFVATLGLPDQTAVSASEFLHAGGQHSRDELGQMIRVWSEAELGARRMERVVLSGHSVGSQIWGDDNGEISFETIIELSGLFPKAAAGVKHLMLSACYSGGESDMAQYHSMFPNVESIWAYHDSSPGTWSGAMDHMTGWEGATESGDEASGVDPELAGRARKAKNVSTWNKDDGYQGGQPMTIWDLQNSLSSSDSMFQEHFSGASEVTDSQTGPLREYYGVIQRFISHPEASGSELTTYQGRRDITIRLLYWGLLRGKFAEHFKAELDSGYQELGQAAPDFAGMSRADAVKHIDEILGAGAEGRLAEILTGLRDLDPTVIPNTWL
jgi:hypothetical protein